MIQPAYLFLLRNRKLISKIIFVWIIIFYAIYFVNPEIRKYITSSVVNTSQFSLRSALDADLNYFTKEGDSLASSSVLKDELKKHDSYSILKILTEQKEQKHLNLLTITDSQGFVITRASAALPRNDNVFLSSVPGRIVIGGKHISGYFEGVVNPMNVYMITGRPILDADNTVLGALFVSNSLDDTYAKLLSEKNRVSGSEVVFYNKQHGIAGSSFDATSSKALQAYFGLGSSWIKNSESDRLFTINNKFYLLRNIPLSEQTGVLLFVPIFTEVRIALGLVAIFLFGVFTIHTIVRRIRKGEKHEAWIYAVTGTAVMVVAFLTGLYIYKTVTYGAITLTRPEQAIYNSVLRFSPDSGPFSKDSDQFISVIVDTGGESVNAIQINVTYNPDELEIYSLDDSSSVCDYIIEKVINNKEGSLKFSCAIIHTANNTHNSTVVRLLIHPKVTGLVSLHFANGTSVKANDGLGTEVLRQTIDASYIFLDKIESLINKQESSTPGKVIVYSMTHPNTERWYTNPNIQMVWSSKIGIINRYALTKDAPGTLKDTYSTTTASSIVVTAPTDGIYYFNVAEEIKGKLGAVTSLPIHIDMSAPEKVTLSASETQISHGSTVRFMVDATDITSGVASGYYVRVDDHLLYPVKGVTYMPFPEKGTFAVTARVFDKAGNWSESTQTITVK